jgi:predicted lipoprotein
VAYIRFGPARADSRQQRLAFFPDPRGVAARQLSATLSRKDPALLEAGALANQSAAIQGLPALELLLTKYPANGEEKIGDYGCGLAMAIGANVVTLSRELADAWPGDGWRARMTKPGSDNPAYKSHEEAAGELVKAVLTGLHMVRDQGFVAIQEAKAKGRTRIGLAFERSGLARDYLAASVRSCAALIATLRLTDFVKDDPKFGWMSGWIKNALRSLERDIEEMEMAPVPVATQPKGTDRVHRGRFYANGLRQIIGRQVAPAAGLTLGFNELDGD